MSDKKKTLRFLFFLMISIIAYGTCVFSLFTTNALLLPLLSFIVLFIALYFLAIDLYYRKHIRLGIVFIVITMLEMVMLRGATRHSYLEIFLFNLAIVLLLFFLVRQLKNRTYFSAFVYFTEWGYTIAAILTLFFSVLMLGKYSSIPFNCDDIDSFSTNLVEAPVGALNSSTTNIKNRRNTLFPPSPTHPSAPHEEVSPLSLEGPEKSEVELFFENTRGFFQTQAVELQGSISRNSCEFVMGTLKKIQINEGFQLAVLVLMYFLLIGVFKIVLRVISVIGFLIFLLLKPFKVYSYERKDITKEFIK